MISLCTALYNRITMLPALEECLNLLPAEGWELLVGDFESTDGDPQFYLRKLPVSWKLISLAGRFSRTAGLNAAFAESSGSKVFFFDVDLLLPADLIAQITAKVKQGQAWLPIVYSLHKDKAAIVSGSSKNANQSNGRFNHQGTGIIGIAREDFLRVGNWNEQFKKWGYEDHELTRRIKRAGIKCFRDPDHGIFHRWHPKEWRKW